MVRILISVLLIFCSVSALHAQDSVGVISETDSLIAESRDTILLKSYANRYSPRKALLYAAVVPGLGQIYNKKYWKLPLVYGGFAFTGYYINWFSKKHSEYKVQLFSNITEAPNNEYYRNPTSGYTTSQLRQIVDNARRNRDFFIIMFGATYVLQIIDAHVDAHLKEFDLNPNLQVSIEPSMEQNPMIGRSTGVSLVFRF